MEKTSTLETQRLNHIILGGMAIVLTLLLVGAGCASEGTTGTDGAMKDGGSTEQGTVTFNGGVTIDCAESGWTCLDKYGGDVTYTDGLGVLTVTETFSAEAATAASEQSVALATQGKGVITEETTEGDLVMITVDSESSNRTHLHAFKTVDGTAYRCTGTIERAAYATQKDNILAMCSSMRK